MAEPHDEAVRQRALRDWSVDRYAVSKGYPIPQWRRGVMWFIADGNAPKEAGRGDPPYMTDHVSWVEKLPNGNYLVADHGTQVLEVRPDYEIVWKYGEYKAGNKLSTYIPNCQYLPSKDSYIISDAGNSRILQVDKETKSVEHELTNTALGSLGTPIARWDWESGDLMLVDEANHVAQRTNWNGDDIWHFGVYGTAGSDDTHLDSPSGVCVNAGRRYPVVADSGNNRTFRFKGGSIQHNLLTPGINTVHVPHEYQNFPFFRNALVLGSWRFVATCEGGSVWNWTPMGCRFASGSRDFTLIYRRHAHAFELDMRTLQNTPMRGVPRHGKLMDSVSLGADASGDIHPFLTFRDESTVIKALSTEDATLDIYSLSAITQIEADSTPRTWNDYDSILLAADTPEAYAIDSPLAGMALQVTMEGTAGTVDVWVEHR